MPRSIAAAAMAYARAGHPVLPLHGITDGRCDCGRADCRDPGKHPNAQLVPHGLKDASVDPERIAAWWRAAPNSNVGLRLDDLALLDVDRDGALLEAGIDLPNGPVQSTGRGFHYLFRANGVSLRNATAFAPGLDLKLGAGAYGVAAPSRHVSGKRYGWLPGHSLEEIPPPDLPGRVVELVKAANASAGGSGDGPHDLLGRLDLERAFLDLEAAEAAGSGDLWRRRVLQIILALVGRGLRDVEIMTFCRRATWRSRGWTHEETDQFVTKELRRARAKADRPEPDDEDTFETDDRERAAAEAEEREDRLRLVPPSEMEWTGAQLNLVKDLLGHAMMALLYGESGSAKTLIALALAIHVALGRDWCGRPVEQGFVAYLAPEGGHSVHLRFHAWCRYHGIDPTDDALPFRTIPVRIDLCRSEADLEQVIANIRAAEVDLGPCVLAVVDTVSRALAGGNENGPEDMGAFVANCDRLREETGATVLGVHHTPSRGETPRGHTSLKNASEVRMLARKRAPGLFALELQHLKDSQSGDELLFEIKTAEVGTNDKGEVVSGALVVPAGIMAKGAAGNPHGRLTDRQLRIMQELWRQADAHRQWQWTNEEFAELCVFSGAIDVENPNTRRSAVNRLKQQLANRGLVTIAGDLVRLVSRV
jgi:hypothetical protein